MIYLNLTEEQKSIIKKPIDILNILFDGVSITTLQPTFSDENCSVIQCTKNTRRSFHDMCEIVKTYLPKETNKNMALTYHFTDK